MTDKSDPTIAPAQLEYREYRSDDLPSLLRLWTDETGWGELTEEQWDEWFVNTPHGPCTVVVAVNEDDRVVGQLVFTPSRVIVDGIEVKSARVSAPILDRTLRWTIPISDLSHPALQLFFTGINLVGEQGVAVIYSLPDRSWLPLFRWVARFVTDQITGTDAEKLLQTNEYGCRALRRSQLQELPMPPNGWQTRAVHKFGSEYADLWRIACDSFPIHCGVVRSPRWLQYKYGGHRSAEVRDGDGKLRGFAVLRVRDGLLVDALAAQPSDVAAVLSSAQRFFAASDDEETAALDQFKMMDMPLFRGAMEEMPLSPVDFKFGFFCGTFDEKLARAISPERWHVSPGD